MKICISNVQLQQDAYIHDRPSIQKADTDNLISCILWPGLTDQAFWKKLAQLIQNIHETELVICFKPLVFMAIIAFHWH